MQIFYFSEAGFGNFRTYSICKDGFIARIQR